MYMRACARVRVGVSVILPLFRLTLASPLVAVVLAYVYASQSSLSFQKPTFLSFPAMCLSLFVYPFPPSRTLPLLLLLFSFSFSLLLLSACTCVYLCVRAMSFFRCSAAFSCLFLVDYTAVPRLFSLFFLSFVLSFFFFPYATRAFKPGRPALPCPVCLLSPSTGFTLSVHFPIGLFLFLFFFHFRFSQKASVVVDDMSEVSVALFLFCFSFLAVCLYVRVTRVFRLPLVALRLGDLLLRL